MRKNLFLKALAVVLAVTMLVGAFPQGALAQEPPAEPAGTMEEGPFTVAFLDYVSDPVGETQAVDKGGAAIAPEAAPAPEGKVFAGWDSEEYRNVTRDLEINALYDEIVCAVTFLDGGGEEISSAEVAYGAFLPVADIPAVEGLAAWKDAAGTEYTPEELAALAVTADLALTAVMAEPDEPEPVVHTVTFAVGDVVSGPVEVANGEVIPAEAVPAADVPEGAEEGTVFLGWFEGEEPFDVAAPVTGEAARAIALTAKFGIPEDAVRAASAASVQLMIGDAPYGSPIPVDGEGKIPAQPAPDAASWPAGAASFLGWYEQGATTPFDFNTVIGADLSLYAQFAMQYTITYEDGEGNVVDTKTVAAGGIIPKTSVTVTAPAGTHFAFWYEEGTDPPDAFDFGIATAQKDTVLLPYFSGQWIVEFVSLGTQVAPALVDDDTPAAEPAAPKRAGHAFKHWSDTPDGAAAYNFNTPVTGNLTLYAVWSLADAGYTVMYWLEKPNIAGDPGTDPANYEFYKSGTRTAQTGSTVALTAANLDAVPYAGFSHSPGQVVKADGSTVVNAYFKRTVYTLRFDLNARNPWSGVRREAQMVFNGVTYYDNNKEETPDAQMYSFTAKVGQDISALWPYRYNANFDRDGTHDTFDSWSKTADAEFGTWAELQRELGPELLPAEGTTRKFYAHWIKPSEDDEYRIHSYYEARPGETGEVEYQGKWYLLKSEPLILAESNKMTPPTIEGMVCANPGEQTATVDGQKKKHFYFYYDWARYALTYNTTGGDAIPPAAGILAGASLAAYEPADDPVKENATFTGWFADAAGTIPFDFTTATMPKGGLTVFAGWETAKWEVGFFDDRAGTVASGDTVSVPDGEYAADPGYYTAGQYYAGKGVFDGWSRRVGTSYLPFGFDLPVKQDMTLLADWGTNGYTVTYEPGLGTGTPFDDPKGYDISEIATVLEPTGFTPPSGEVFAGWMKADGAGPYYPGNGVTVDGNMTLTARWIAAGTGVTYHTNNAELFPEEQTVVWNAGAGESIQLGGEDVFTHATGELIGWSETPGGTDVVYALGADYTVPDTMAHLYGVWQITGRKLTVVTETASKPYDGEALTGADAGLASHSGVLEGDRFEPVLGGSVLHVNEGEETNELVSWKVWRGEEDVSDEYTVDSLTEGTISITAREVHVVGGSDTFYFDGTLKEIDDWDIHEETPMAEGDTLSGVSAYGSGVFPNDPLEPHTVTVDLTAAEVLSTIVDAEDDDYALVPVHGQLVILDSDYRVPWSITGTDEEEEYTGQEQQNANFSVDLSAMPAGAYSTGSVTVTPAKGTNVAASIDSTAQTTYYQTFDTSGIKFFMSDGVKILDATAYFANPTITPGTLKINPAPLLVWVDGPYGLRYGDEVPTLAKDDNVWLYYGDWGTSPPAKYFVNSEGESVLDFTNAEFTTTYRQDMQAGDEFTATVAGIKPDYGNYALEILPYEDDVREFGLWRLHVTGDSGSREYSGGEQKIDTYTVTGFGLTDEGEYGIAQDAGPRDGEVIMPNGDRIVPNLPYISALGKGTNVGQYDVVTTAPQFYEDDVEKFDEIWAAMDIVDVNGNSVKDNYFDNILSITTQDGLLDITPAPLTVTAGSFPLQAGSPVPAQDAFPYNISGYKGGDSRASLGGTLAFSTAYTPQAAAGQTFPIVPSGLTSTNYAIQYMPGVLTVSADQAGAYWVLFVDYDGTVLKDYQWLDAGSNAVPPANPTRAGYTFAGWDIPFTNVQSNLTVTATYTTVAGAPATEGEGGTPPEGGEGGGAAGGQTGGGEGGGAGGTLPEETIPEPTTPATPGAGAWSLINLILMIATGVAAIWLLAGYFIRRKRKNGEETEEKKRAGLTRILSILPFAAALILFLLTEDMSAPMVIFDQWTVWMAVIAAVQAVLVVLSVAKRKQDEPASGEAQ